MSTDRAATNSLRMKADELKITAADLDELIHEMKAEEASAINNAGIEGQLEAMFNYYGYDRAMAQLEDLMAGVPE